MPSVEIIIACLPEEIPEQSAAWELASRARSKLEADPQQQAVLVPLREESVDETSNSTIYLFLVSCGADGSVNRNVRKLIKKVKDESTLPSEYSYCIALLDHAVCKTSAEQMNEQTFAAGRRMAKSFQQKFGLPIQDRLETQVELVAPEDAFDPWIQGLSDKIKLKINQSDKN
jgi:hypothetical protein